MAIGGIMMDAFYIVLGNPDVMVALITFAVISTLVLTTFEIFNIGEV